MPDITPKETKPMEFVFANAFGGATQSTSPPMIFAKLRELRREVGSVAAERAQGVPFPVRGAKDLNQKLAQALDTLNLIAPMQEQKVTLIDVHTIPPNTKGEPLFRTMAHVQATVRIIAEDGSFVDMVGSGHGGDRDDKAGGKASTYAWKDAILKGLTIPHEDMVDTDDEAPSSAVTASKEKTPKAKVMPNTAPQVKPEPPTVVPEPPELPAEDPKGLEYVLAQIKKAETEDALNVIKKAITDGTLSISGTDRLKASSAYVERRKFILEAKPPAN